jgi:acetyl-CoA carboxylase carboxyl transferase subunit alpha
VPAEPFDFEEPVTLLLKEVEAMRLMPQTPDRRAAIGRLEARAEELRAEIYAHLDRWQRVLVARHPGRPCTIDYIERLFTDFIELAGDRRFADDKAIVAGLARFRGRPVVVMGHQKGGRDTKEKIFRNFGYAKPEGYRKALRVLKLAEKFHRPVIIFVDTPAAYPGIESEERGVAEAIALNLREMSVLDVPIVVLVCGEGGSGGALGLAIGDRVLMQEFAVYSVIPPEGCAAILWRDAKRKVEAAEALKLAAGDLLALGLVDEIVKEPPGGAHSDPEATMALVDAALERHLTEIEALESAARLDARYAKFRAMGRLGQAYAEDVARPEASDGGSASAAPERT